MENDIFEFGGRIALLSSFAAGAGVSSATGVFAEILSDISVSLTGVRTINNPYCTSESASRIVPIREYAHPIHLAELYTDRAGNSITPVSK